MQGGFRIDMLAGVYRVRRPAGVYGVLNFFLRVVASANKFESINDLDLVRSARRVGMKSASLKLVTCV